MGEKARKQRKRRSRKRGEERRILVQSFSATNDKDGEKYGCFEFHMVDLKKGEVVHNYLPALPKLDRALSKVASVGDSIYVFGLVESDDNYDHLLSQKYFTGSSRFDLKSESKVWYQAPRPRLNAAGMYIYSCTTLCGKIYSFGFDLNLEFLDPYDGRHRYWRPVYPKPPCELVGSFVTVNPIQDSSNDRIIVRLSGGQLSSPCLYAFSSQHEWTCIARDFHFWTAAAAVVDDVIYFHHRKTPAAIRAFHITTGTWLNVDWCSTFGKNLTVTGKYYEELFHLGNGVLCLVAWLHALDSDYRFLPDVNVTFVKFRVKRQLDSPTVRLAPISYRSYTLPDTCEVNTFLAF